MKLARFTLPGDSTVQTGLVLDDVRIVAVQDLIDRYGGSAPTQIASYVAQPASAASALRRLVSSWRAVPQALPRERIRMIPRVRLLPPLNPTALFDFALAPEHLQRSARTLMTREMPALLRPLAIWIAQRKVAQLPATDALKFYVGVPTLLSGPGDVICWPGYTSYLDIEPELAVVTSALPRDASAEVIEAGIAGYTILNDLSARDVQYPEMQTGTLGFMQAKHFQGSNGLGPWLVTPDELGQPYQQDVSVDVGNRLHWTGTTAAYRTTAIEALTRLTQLFDLPAGTVVGLGTVPGCCGLDLDQWVRPGERVRIQFSGIGTLEQTLGTPPAPGPTSRWAQRTDLYTPPN